MRTKATPEKWRIGDTSFNGNYLITDDDDNIIAEAEQKDNAAYIVKAVNNHAQLVEALHAIYEHLKSGFIANDSAQADNIRARLEEQGKKALAAAEGREVTK